MTAVIEETHYYETRGDETKIYFENELSSNICMKVALSGSESGCGGISLLLRFFSPKIREHL